MTLETMTTKTEGSSYKVIMMVTKTMITTTKTMASLRKVKMMKITSMTTATMTRPQNETKIIMTIMT